MSDQKKFRLPENNTGFVGVEIFDDFKGRSCLVFHHKDGFLLYVYQDEVSLVDMNRGGEEVGSIRF